MLVDIKRSWLDTSLLNLSNWFLEGDYKKHCISDGTMSQQLSDRNLEHIFLPYIVTSLILIKDLSISWENWQSDGQSRVDSDSSIGSIGYGPFAVSGNYSHHGSQVDILNAIHQVSRW